MHIRIIVSIIGMLLCLSSYAADYPDGYNDAIKVFNYCSAKKYKDMNPSLTSAKMDECTTKEATEQGACLGLTGEQLMQVLNDCATEGKIAACMKGKYNISQSGYANCYFNETGERQKTCFASLGNAQTIMQQISDCRASETGQR